MTKYLQHLEIKLPSKWIVFDQERASDVALLEQKFKGNTKSGYDKVGNWTAA